MGTGAVDLVHDGVTTDITDRIDRTQTRIEFQANPINGVAIVVIRDDDGTLAIRERDEIHVKDDGSRIWGGEIATLDPDTDEAPAITYTAKCQSFDSLLEQRVIPIDGTGVRSGARYDDDDVAWIISFGADLGLDGTTFVSRLRTDPLPEIDYGGRTLKGALDLLAQYTTGATRWVDQNKAVRWTDPASAQLVDNPDFEDGATNWSLDGSAAVDEDGGPGGTGDAALEVTGSGVGRHESTQTVAGVVGDRRYMVFADLWSDTADGAAIRLDWQDVSSVSQRIDTIDNGSVTSEWTRQRAILTAPASATKVIVRAGVANNSTAAAAFDNINIVGEDAAWGVSTSPDGTTTMRFWRMKRPTDATGPINRVLVRGNGISDWREHAASIAYFGGRKFEGVLEDERVTTTDGIDSRAAYVFRKFAFPAAAGTYETDATGLVPGTMQIIENEVTGLQSIEWIATVVTTFEGNDHLLHRVTFGSPEDDMGAVLAAVGSAFEAASSDVGVADPVTPGSDTSAPAVPTGLVVSTGSTQAPDGTDRPYLLAAWDAVADVDLNAYEVQTDRALDGEVTIAASASGAGGLLPAGTYAVTVTGLGSEAGETGVTTDPAEVVLTAGQRLYVNITAKPGCGSYRIYASILAGDETQPQRTAQTTTTTGSDVEITAAGGSAVYPPATSTAVSFTNPASTRTGAVSHYVENVLGGTYYAARVRAIDHSGNASDWTTPGGATAADDTAAPAIPSGVALTSGHRIIGARWTRPSDADIALFQVRWAPESAPGSGLPDTALWDRISTLTNWVIIPDLDPGSADGTTAPTVYFVQVRSIDRSGNVRTSALVSAAVDADANPDAGWSNDGTDEAYVSASPVLLSGSTDVAYGTIVADHLSSEGISAGLLTAGTISVGGQPNTPDYLLVYDATGDEIGRWDAAGLVIRDPTNPSLALRIMRGVLEFTEAYDEGDPDASPWTTAMSALGIRADAITLGTAPGGHNAVPNSSFELAEFATALSKVWTASGDWGAYIGTKVNLTTTGADLTLTDVTY